MTERVTFAELFLHPVVVAAVALLLANDHIFKTVAPSWATGKMSDVAGLVFFPLLLAVMAQILWRRPGLEPRHVLAGCIAVTAVVFVAVQTIPVAGDAYRVGLGLLQWPFRFVLDGGTASARVALTPDPTDLVALPVLGLTWWLGIRRLGPEGADG